ncbi:MAG: hypothetical protein R2838_05515 [Caldilineaceae bacterium]
MRGPTATGALDQRPRRHRGQAGRCGIAASAFPVTCWAARQLRWWQQWGGGLAARRA